jgi:prepilin-type processing-associated H-X9-DG protein
MCPSNWADDSPYSSYAGCHHDAEAPIDADNRGVFFLNSRLTRDDLKDGVAYTLFIGEKLIEDTDLGWLSGTPATLRNTGTQLNPSKFKGTWTSGTLPWLYSYDVATDDEWAWVDEPPADELMEFNPETGEPMSQDAESPVTDSPTTDEPQAPTDDESQPAGESATPTTEEAQPDADAATLADAAQPPAPETTDPPAEDAAAGEMFDEFGKQKPLKADANGLYPHSRLGGNPKKPLAVGGFSSPHADGVNFALGDGSVRFIADSVNARLMGRLANRADGKMIDAREW